jgi:NitT/TauT family transport system substrate-binding protein
VAVVSACGGDSSSSGRTAGTAAAPAGRGAPETKNVTFGVVPTVGYAPIFIAQQKGFFRQEGLNVTTRVINPATTVPSLVGGGIQGAGVTWIAYLISTNRGIGLQFIHEEERGTPGYTAIVAKKGSGIRSMKDLIGKKVATPGEPGICSLIGVDVLKRQGLDGTKIKWTGVAIPDMLPTLQSGGVDAACIPQPALAGALRSGRVTKVLDLMSGKYDRVPIVTYATTKKFAEANPNTVAALSRALEKSAELIKRDPSIVDQVMPGVMKLPPAVIKNATKPDWPVAADPPPNVALVARLAEQSGAYQGHLNVPRVSNAAKG